VAAMGLAVLVATAPLPVSAGCPVIGTFHCDETLTGSLAGATNAVSEYACMPFQSFSGPEVAFQFVAWQDDLLTIEFWGKGVGDLMVLEDSCDGTTCLQWGGGLVMQPVKGGHTYYFVVEAWEGVPAVSFQMKLKCQSTCKKMCDGKECGDDGCGGSCGECAPGGSCWNSVCLEGDGCTETWVPGCNGCACEGCVCAIYPHCCEKGWDFGCVEMCAFQCQGCGLLENCGDGVCQPLEFEKCDTCAEDCGCQPGESCFNGACCHPSCDGKACGDDGCGGWCGDCGTGVCSKDGQCLTGPGCEYSDVPGCGGCMCEACVCAMDPFCCQTAWDGLCIDECVNWCEGCSKPKNCGDGKCQPDELESCSTCMEDCPCQVGEKCYQGKCCHPDCTGKECGDDGCGGQCGECPWNEACVDFECGPNDGCTVWKQPGCGGCLCEPCVCDMYPWCCFDGWFPECVDLCQWECGGCGLLENCGDGQCDSVGGENCGNCPGDCACDGDGICFKYSCCYPSCDGKECGDDGCGGWCGDCDFGLGCDGGQCVPNDGCLTWPSAGCGGCPCEGCVCGMDSYCCQVQWDSLCVDECQFQCGGCISMLNCGDGQCQPFEGETCTTCKEDCGCKAGESCFNGACCKGSCDGKQCGADGCGGSCGKCPCKDCPPENNACSPDGQCIPDTSTPCKKFMECLMSCEDDWCLEGCSQQVGPDGMKQYELWMNCMLANGIEGCWDTVCTFQVWESCLAEFNGCTGGGASCPTVAECMMGCGSDGKCANKCLLEGSPEANEALWGFLICAFGYCTGGEFDGGCLEKMAAGQCAVEYSACSESCIPNCAGKECGQDGCGWICGECPLGVECQPGGTCEDVCEPQCDGKECGPDGCGGKCGGCDQGEHCTPTGSCEPDCVPECDGKGCGDDGCGGSCGTCAEGESCSDEGQCVATVDEQPEVLPDAAETDMTPGVDLAEVAQSDLVGDMGGEDSVSGPEATVSSSTSCAGCATSRPNGGAAPLLVMVLSALLWAGARRASRSRCRETNLR